LGDLDFQVSGVDGLILARAGMLVGGFEVRIDL
jgi:hypothetical protein